MSETPLTPEEETKFRESVRLLELAEGESGVNALHWTNTVAERLLATLDAEREMRLEFAGMVNREHEKHAAAEKALDAARSTDEPHFHRINGMALWFEGTGGKPVGGPEDD